MKFIIVVDGQEVSKITASSEAEAVAKFKRSADWEKIKGDDTDYEPGVQAEPLENDNPPTEAELRELHAKKHHGKFIECKECEAIISGERQNETDQPASCPICGGEAVPLGALGKRFVYRCRACGMEFHEVKANTLVLLSSSERRRFRAEQGAKKFGSVE